MILFRSSYTNSLKQCLNNYHVYNNCLCNKPVTNFRNHSRLYHLITRNYGRKITDLKTPDLVYFPQIIRWLKTKIGFKLLQKTWDPEFSEGAFIYGSTKAICRITEEINKEDENGELKKLVTPQLRKKLLTDINVNMTSLQKQIIVLTPNDIKLLIPIQVRLLDVNDKKHCSVGLRTLAVKWHNFNGVLRLAIIALQTEFIRDYTDSISTDLGWTVRVFDILECGVVGDAKLIKK